jgi:DNA mismatch repair protein MSH2
VVAVAATFCEVWTAVAALVSELDVLGGFADLATADPTRPYCKPEVLELDAGEITIKVSSRCLIAVPHLYAPGISCRPAVCARHKMSFAFYCWQVA